MYFVKSYYFPEMEMAPVIVDTRPDCAAHVTHYRADGTEIVMTAVDLGMAEAFDPVDLEGNSCSHAHHIALRLEKHPFAESHADAPKLRFSAHLDAVPTMHFCPAGVHNIKSHIDERGRDGLPDMVKAHLRELWRDRDDLTPSQLIALGHSAAEIKARPKFAEKLRAQAERSAAVAATQAAARQRAAEIEQSIRASRDRAANRRLARNTEVPK